MIGKLHGLKKDLKTRAFRLLQEIEKATGAHLKRTAAGPLSRTQAATDAGLSGHQRKNYENVKELVVETADLIRLTLGGRRSTA
jgi:hypothetical protein